MTPDTDHPPNVVLVVLDSLRPDFLSCYGATAVETPNLDAVADAGVRFENAFAAGPGTPVSHAALFTGQYPGESGVTGQFVDLPEDSPVLAEWLRDRGYETRGIAGPSKMASDFGFDRGFDEYFEPYYDVGFEDRRPTARFVRNVLADPALLRDAYRAAVRGEVKNTRLKFDLLEGMVADAGEPFFAFANILEAHVPYHPPRPYRQRFTPAYDPPPLYLLEYLFDAGTFDSGDVRLDRVRAAQTADGVGRYLADPDYLREAELSVLRSWYAAAAKYLDDRFGAFLAFYRERLADDTYLVVTADHGEQLGEHGMLEHSHKLFDETVRVPLLVTGPGLGGGVVREDIVSLVDAFDTVCDVCGFPAPDSTSGRSWFSGPAREFVFLQHGRRDPGEFAAESPHARYMDREQLASYSAGRKAVRSDEHKYVVTSAGAAVLYDLPGESPVREPDGAVVDELDAALAETLPAGFGRWPEEPPGGRGLSDRVTENLRRLGYVE